MFYLISRKLLNWLPITQLLTLYKVCTEEWAVKQVVICHLVEDLVEYSLVSQPFDIEYLQWYYVTHQVLWSCENVHRVARKVNVVTQRKKQKMKQVGPSLSEKVVQQASGDFCIWQSSNTGLSCVFY